MPEEYRSAFEIIAVILTVALIAMGFMVWHIQRGQVPKELRWPKKSPRRHRKGRR